uniref:DNA-directed DNA polymerase n=1 Tax=Moniliophthora perniciosa TaxID=153609 RepID=UPI0000242371|nr:DNA-directed DNA polymerase [Moniliophthora perniciosa]AAQ74286.1 DNA-directed DNA polymerase [Moniliophthora perniciosa]
MQNKKINNVCSIINKWNDFSFKINSNFITDNLIKISLTSFKAYLLNNIDKNLSIKILILFKIKTINNQYRTISYMQCIDIKDFELLNKIFIEYWNLRSDDYYLAQFSHIIFTYKIIKLEKYSLLDQETKIVKVNDINKNELKTNSLKYGRFNIPSTMDFNLWGVAHWIDDSSIIVYKSSSDLEYHIKLFENYQTVDLMLDDNLLLSFKDTMNDKYDLSTFNRKFKNQEYFFQEGELVLNKIEKKVQFLTKTKRNMYNSKKFITMDLETRVINEVMTSFCVSLYDGKNFKSFYLSDFDNEKEMLRESIKFIMKRKYDNYKVYLHNFSKFDAIFLLNILTDLSNSVHPIIRDGRFINLRFNFASKYNLYFRDSLLLLPASLNSLAKEFNVTNKGIFPYTFVNNENISLNYVGLIPDLNYFENISAEEYEIYSSKFNNDWNLRKETIKYCELDCLVLYKIIDKFSNYIFELFRVDIIKYPTLSSLAFAIFRSKFLGNSKIPLIHGEIFNFIKESYTGGSVDVYKPCIEFKNENTKVYRYDVNSLYPFVMKNFPMPTGEPIYFEGDILNIYNNEGDKPFGIFEVEITTPEYIKIPLLQKRIKTDKGYRTISPIGNWTGKYFSEELYNAAKYGYKFQIKRGYLFKKGNIFEEYVDFLYELKKNSSKGSPNYIISKLLLNSLYGRLGMNPIAENHIIISNEEALKLYSKKNITNIIDLKNGKELISFFSIPTNSYKDDYNIKNTSVVVSTAVTASARIYMTQFKTDKNLIIYYSDTDSIDVNKELESKFIGNELGQMKLEHIFDDAVFLAPKMYGGITKDYEYVRIKGLKNPIKFNELKSLLKKEEMLEIKQQKWYSDISNGVFHIKDEIYTLMVNNKKRKLIYNENNEFIDTKPIKLKNDTIID